MRRQSAADAGEIDAAWRELEEAGSPTSWPKASRRARSRSDRIADVRYFGEATRSRSTIPAGSPTRPRSRIMWSEFHKVHERTFGFAYEGKQDVELVNLRVQAVGR